MKKIILSLFILIFFFLFSTNNVLALSNCSCNGNKTVVDNCTSCLQPCICTPISSDASGAEVKLDSPLPNVDSPEALVGNIIKAAMGIIGSLALAMFIYGGFVWMTAAGNAERVKQGKDILIWATLGLVAIFASYSIISFLITNLG